MNNLDFDGLLPVDAFKKEGGRMRLHGGDSGGGSPAPAPAPVFSPAYNTYDYKTGKYSMEATPPAAYDPTATPLIVASTYKDVLGRAPTLPELSQYKDTTLKASEIKSTLMQSPEYMNKLTKSFIPPVNYDAAGQGSISGIPPTQSTAGIASLNAAMQKQLGQPTAPLQFAAPPSAQAPQAVRPVDRPAVDLALPASQTGLPPSLPSGTPNVTPTYTPSQAEMAAIVQQQLMAKQLQDRGIGSIKGRPVESGNISSAGTSQYAEGGLSGLRPQYNLGGYSDGGRLLRGPGDGVSDSIPAQIGDKQPARLADGEFVIPARIVSELGNGSTDAGARRLYAMMDKIQHARRKSIGKKNVAVNSRADKYLPS
jgi:hypothetical protein